MKQDFIQKVATKTFAADMAMKVEAARLMVYNAAARAERGDADAVPALRFCGVCQVWLECRRRG